MQRVEPCALKPEEYAASGGHRRVVPEAECPRCGWRGRLHRHGSYERGITTETGQVVRIEVARFRCSGCGRTISYLPGFAMSYRLVQVSTFEAFLDGRCDRRDVQRWEELLRQYRRRMLAYGSEVRRVLGGGFGRAPPGAQALWPLVREACGSLAAATRRLVTQYKITLFGRYQCHQPAAAV